jgi:replication fork clamp-binding protein CrfC
MDNLIKLTNKLQDCFTNAGIPALSLPQIAVVGSQSSGKSSILENIVGKDFLPRGSGIVTRRPLILQLVHNSSDSTEYGVFSHLPEKKFYDFVLVRKEIQDETDRSVGSSKAISSHPINLRIVSPKVLNLTLIDLPGLTKVAIGDQPHDVSIQIKSMIMEFIQNDNCLILAISPANADIANSDALQLAKEVDPSGRRTIGVLTKLDLMDEGTDCLDILTNKVIPLVHGFVGVVNRSQKDIDNNKNVSSAIAKEKEWFENHQVYTHISGQCGTKFLQEKLHKTLVNHIHENLPSLKKEIQKKAFQLKKDLSELNAPYEFLNSSDNLQVTTDERHVLNQKIVFSFIESFSNGFRKKIDGHDGDILNSFDRDVCEENELNSVGRIKFIFHRIYPNALNLLESKIFSCSLDDEIRVKLYNNRGLRSGIFVPDSVFEVILKTFLLQLEKPALDLAQCVYIELSTMINSLLDSYPYNNFPRLKSWLIVETTKLLEECMVPTMDEIKRLIRMEVCYINSDHPDFIGRQGINEWIADQHKKNSKNQEFTRYQEKSGHLFKLGGTNKTWKRRFFTVGDGILKFFDNESAIIPKGEFSLRNCCIKDITRDIVLTESETIPEFNLGSALTKGKSNLFLIGSKSLSLFRNHQYLLLSADSAIEKDEWCHVLNSNIKYASSFMERPPTPIRNENEGDLRDRDQIVQLEIPKSLKAQDLKNAYIGTSVNEYEATKSKLAQSDELTISLIKLLIQSYFKIVKKHIQDLAPKAIMLLMISSIKAKVSGILSGKVIELESGVLKKNVKIGDLLEESESVVQERNAKTKMFKILQDVLTILDTEIS